MIIIITIICDKMKTLSTRMSTTRARWHFCFLLSYKIIFMYCLVRNTNHWKLCPRIRLHVPLINNSKKCRTKKDRLFCLVLSTADDNIKWKKKKKERRNMYGWYLWCTVLQISKNCKRSLHSRIYKKISHTFLKKTAFALLLFARRSYAEKHICILFFVRFGCEVEKITIKRKETMTETIRCDAPVSHFIFME